MVVELQSSFKNKAMAPYKNIYGNGNVFYERNCIFFE